MRKEYHDLLIAKQFFFSMTKTDEPQQLKETGETPQFNSGRWLQDEHKKFIEAIFLYGNEWRKVERFIKTRSAAQARSHAQKFFINIQKKYLEEHGHSIILNQEDQDSVSHCLIKFVIHNLNCENISTIFKESKSDITASITTENEYYKDDCKYKFMLHLQKLKNAGNHLNKKDFICQLKEKFVKLVLSLLHNTRAHNRKLATLGEYSRCAGNCKIINLLCENENEKEKEIDNDNEKEEEEEDMKEQSNPFYLCEFDMEKNSSTNFSCSNIANDLYVYDCSDNMNSIFDYNPTIYNNSMIL